VRCLLLILLVSGCVTSAPTQPGVPDASSLIGVWALRSTEAFDRTGESVYTPTVQTGLLILTKSHYALMWTRTPRPPAAQPWNATETERLARDATMIAHAGRYRRQGNELVMLPESAKSPEFVGGLETFTVRVDASSLQLTATDARSLDGTVVSFYAHEGRQEYVFARQSPARAGD